MSLINFNTNLGFPFNKIDEIGTDVSYEFRKLSTSVTDVIKIVSDETYNFNAKTAYDPEHYNGFAVNYEASSSPYLVKQANNDGKVVYTGLLLRYVPSDNRQTLFIKSLFGNFDYNNNIIFANHKDKNAKVTSPFSQGFSFGSSIKSINDLSNVMKISVTYRTDTSYFTSTQRSPFYQYDYGVLLRNIVIKTGRSPDLTKNDSISTGKILASLLTTENGDGTTTDSFIISLDNNKLKMDNTNADGGVNYVTKWNSGEYWYIEEVLEGEYLPCGRYAIDQVMWINDTGNSSNFVQEIIFEDSVCSTGVNYIPVLTGDTEDLVQYNYLSSSIVNGYEYLSKIKGETLSWDKGSKTLIAITTTKFQKEFGTIYYFGDAGCGDGLGGKGINTESSNITPSSGFFANISSDYNITSKDYTVGNTAIQDVLNTSSWSKDTIYNIGDIVTQYNKSFSAPLYSDNTFQVINFSKAASLGESFNQPSTLSIKPIGRNTKLNITSNVGMNTALLPLNSGNSYNVSTFPYLLNRTIVYGNKEFLQLNTIQIVPNLMAEEVTNKSSSFFSNGIVYASESSNKIGSCIITNVDHVINSKFKINISDIRPYANFSLEQIFRNIYSFSSGGKILFTVSPESTKYNKLELTYDPDSTFAYHLFSKGDIIVNRSGSRAIVVDVESRDFGQTKGGIGYTFQVLIIERLSPTDSIFDSETVITGYYDTSIFFDLGNGVKVTSCDSYGDIYMENLTKDGFLYPLNGGLIFSKINPGTLSLRKTTSGLFSSSDPIDTGGGTIKNNYSLIYATPKPLSDGAGFNVNKTNSSQYIQITGSPPTVRVTPPPTALNSFVFSAEYEIDIDKYRIKNLETHTETRNLKYTPYAPATDVTSEIFASNIYCYLTKCDAYKIDQIKYGDNDITKYFILDSGERKDMYGFSKISFNYDYTKQLCTLLGIDTNISTLNDKILTSGIGITIIYSYFEHIKQDGISGPVVKDSYVYGTKSKIPNEEIGYSIVGVNNIKTHKSALIDFRPLYTVKEGTQNAIGQGDNPYDYPDKLDVSFSLLPSNVINVSGTHYLSRKDSLYLTQDGEFKINQGLPSIDPILPTTEIANAMKLYDIFVPGYTANVEDIKITSIENKRYTMRDIGKLEKRIKNVEYYTQLSLVEKKATDLIVKDSNGLERSKNGIIVDNFETFLISDTSNSDFNACIDIRGNVLRHPVLTSRFGFKFHKSIDFKEVYYNQNTVGGVGTYDIRKLSRAGGQDNVPTGLYMLKPTTLNKPFIVQPAASSAVALVPLDGTKTLGNIIIDPPVDDWVDTKQLPAIRVDLMKGFNEVLNNITDSLINNNLGVWGTKYGEWTTTNTYVANTSAHNGQQTQGHLVQERDANKTTLDIKNESISLGERVTDVSIAHYIRAQDLYLYITGLKPNTRIYAFLDNVNIDDLCSVVSPSNPSGTPFKSLSYIPKTNSSGNVIVKFNLKAGAYRTGDRIFNITDSSTNDKFNIKTTMYATGVFSSSGLTTTKQETIAEGRQFSTKTTQLTNESNSTTGNTDTKRDVVIWTHDPIAQTFVINKDLYPSGIYISSFDFCFSTKDPVVGVMAELRPTVNGYPDSKKIHPQGVSVLPSSSVKALSELTEAITPNITDPTKYTRFVFNPPVYLEPGEHAVVLHSESTKYTVYAGTIGEDDISTAPLTYVPTPSSSRRILSQPYIGEFFRSSNASTWIADGSTDLMFSANLCTFVEDASLTEPKTKTMHFIVDTNPEVGSPFGGTFGLFEASNTLSYQLVNLKNYIKDVKDTTTKTNLSLVSGTTIPYSDVSFDTDIILNKTMILDKTQINDMDSNTIKLSFESTIYNPYVTPIIDIKKSGIILVRNMIDTTEIDSNETIKSTLLKNEKLAKAVIKQDTLDNVRPATLRYITKMVTLADGFDATNCKVIMTINKPEGTGVAVFVRVENIGSSGNFNSLPYRELLYTGLKFNSKNNEYNEMEFVLPEDIKPFDKFSFKICLFSNNSAVVPKIADFIGMAIL